MSKQTCKQGKWVYSEIFEVTGYQCYREKRELGCYFINCQEVCPNYITKKK